MAESAIVYLRTMDSQKRGMYVISVFNFISMISASVFTFTPLQPYQGYIKLLLMQTEHFLLLLLHVKSIPLVQHRVAFIVKQSQEVQCICHSDPSSKMRLQQNKTTVIYCILGGHWFALRYWAVYCTGYLFMP